MKRSPTLAAVLASSLLLLTACGGGSDDGDGAEGSTTTAVAGDTGDGDATTTTAGDDDPADDPDGGGATSTTSVGAAPDDNEGIAPIEELAAGLLITLDELGNTKFSDAGYTPNEGPNACGYDLDAEHPAEVLVGATYGDEGRVFQQEIRVYATAADALEAYNAGVANTTCDAATGGLAMTGPVDVTDEVGADQAAAFTATLPSYEATLVAALVSDALVTFQFGTSTGATEAADAPDPIDLTAFGIGKILAALEEG